MTAVPCCVAWRSARSSAVTHNVDGSCSRFAGMCTSSKKPNDTCAHRRSVTTTSVRERAACEQPGALMRESAPARRWRRSS